MDNIEALLKEKGLTKTAFSELLGIKKQNLNGLMKNPTLETIKKFASVLDVPMWQLFASPEEVAEGGDITALIQHKGDFYKACTIAELENIIGRIKENSK